jgi:hypothetical protein
MAFRVKSNEDLIPSIWNCKEGFAFVYRGMDSERRKTLYQYGIMPVMNSEINRTEIAADSAISCHQTSIEKIKKCDFEVPK